MDPLTPFSLTPEREAALRSQTLGMGEVISFREQPEFCSLVASVGLWREIGTHNDELAPFLYDAPTGQNIPVANLRAELVQYRGHVGVRVWAPGHAQLELRLPGIKELLNPRFSYDAEGSLYQCVFFPQSIAKILALQDTHLVVVRAWAMNTIFGGFGPAQPYYQTNFWELENNDTLRFANLLTAQQIPLLGTHDLCAHIAGVAASAWPGLRTRAQRVKETLQDYFSEVKVPTLTSLVIPYVVGVLLDDLAQPRHYSARSQALMIEEGLKVIAARAIHPAQSRVLMKFPASVEGLIQSGRSSELSRADAQAAMARLVDELSTQSIALKTNA